MKNTLEPASSAITGVQHTLRNLRPLFFDGLTPSELEPVIQAAMQIKAEAASIITNQDDSAERLFLLLTGCARYFLLTDKGKKVILHWIRPGQTFGTTALMSTPGRYILSTETVRTSSMLAWDRATIRRLATRYARLLDNAFSESVRYLTVYRAAHMALVSDTASRRLAQVLISLATGIGQNAEGGVELKIRNEELANQANVTLFTASRLLNRWQRAGVLSKGRGKIVLRSPELLLRSDT